MLYVGVKNARERMSWWAGSLDFFKCINFHRREELRVNIAKGEKKNARKKK